MSRLPRVTIQMARLGAAFGAEAEMLLAPKPKFSMVKGFSQLIKADYRIREHTFGCLERLTEEQTTDDAQDHARFERAFCHSLGFGTAKCVTKVRALLGHSDPRIGYFEDAVANLRKNGYHSFTNAAVEALTSTAHLGNPNLSYEYWRSDCLINVVNLSHREYRTMPETFGPVHFATSWLGSVPMHLMIEQSDYQSCENFASRILEVPPSRATREG